MAAMQLLRVPAIKQHTSTVILAHGLGDSGNGWTFLTSTWRSQNKFQETEFIFPSAPQIPITVNGGMRMPGWYDIADFSDLEGRDHDEIGIKRSQSSFAALIADEVSTGIPADRIVVGGFSQGAAVSLVTGLASPTKLGGIFALSGYLPMASKLQELIPQDTPNKDTTIFMGHGDADPVVRYAWGVASAKKLEEWGCKVDFKTYRNLGHSADPDEINDLEKYLMQRIPDTASASTSAGSSGSAL